MSTLKCTTLSKQDGSASVPVDTVVNGSAKAWVNFNGTGTVAIRASFNVASITDNGVGDYTVNFTSAMPDASYCVQLNGEAQSESTTNHNYNMNANLYGSKTDYIVAASCRIKISGGVSAYGLNDCAQTHVAIFR